MNRSTLALTCALAFASACAQDARSRLPAMPSSLAQAVVEGQNPPDQTFTLSNVAPGNCAMSWSMSTHASSGGDWLSASAPMDATSGTLAVGGSVEITVRMKPGAPNNLVPGTYTGAIVFEGTCVENGLRARGSPGVVAVNLRVRPKPGSLTVRWTVGGQPASMTTCPEGSSVEVRAPGVVNATYAPCTAGTVTIADAPLGLGPVFVALREQNPDAPDLSAVDAPYVLRPDGSATVDVGLLTAVPDTDGVLRSTDAPACRTARDNLLANGGFESVPALEGNYIAGMLPHGWTSVESQPFVVDSSGTFGLLPDELTGYQGLTAQSGQRFVSLQATSPGYPGDAFSQPLSTALVSGRQYRVRAMVLRSADTTSHPGNGAFMASLTNDDRSRIRYVGRMMPAAGLGWQNRSFAFQAPADAATYTRLEFRSHTRFADAPSRTGIDGIALQDVTGCTRACLFVTWSLAGANPAYVCPPGSKVRLHIPANGSMPAQSRTVDCTASWADWKELEPGGTGAQMLLLAADDSVLDRQELPVDLRAPNAHCGAFGVRHHMAFWAVGREPDGTPAAATTPVCDGASEILLNGGFEDAPRGDRSALPANWAYAPTNGAYTTLWSVDMGVGYFPGNFFEDDFIGATPGEGANFISQWRIPYAYLAQRLSTPLQPGATYRVRGLVRNGSLGNSSPDPGGFALFLTNADGDAGRAVRARLLPPTGFVDGERWQVRSAVFVAPSDANQYTHFGVRGANLYSATGTDLGPRNAGAGLDALSLTRVDGCASLPQSGRIRLTWHIGNGIVACEVGDVIQFSVNGGARVSVPCVRLVHELPVTTTRPHLYAEVVRGGQVIAALEREVEVPTYGVGRAHFDFLRTVTGYNGQSCNVHSRACFGTPVELLPNGSFEQLPSGANPDDVTTQPQGWEVIGGNAYTYSLDATLGGAMEGAGGTQGYYQIRPADGLRFRNFIAGPYIFPENGEGNSTKMMRPALLLQADRRYRVRAFIRRASPVGVNVGRGVSFRVRLGPDNDPLPSADKMNLRADAGTFCPVSGNEWEMRSFTFTAPNSGPYVYFDSFTDDENGQNFALDHVSMTDVTDCGL